MCGQTFNGREDDVKRSTVRRYMLFSFGFGIGMGLIFPPFAALFTNFKTPSHILPFVLLCVVAGIVVGGASYLIGRLTIIAALRQVSGYLTYVEEQGDLTHTINLQSHDIIGKIFTRCNNFVNTLNSLIGGIKDVSEDTSDLSVSLYDTSVSMLDNIREIDKRMDQTNKVIKQQEHLLQDTTGEMENVSCTMEGEVGRVNDQVVKVKQISSMLGEIITSISSVASQTRDKENSVAALKQTIAEGTGFLREFNRELREIADKNRMIQDFVVIINAIAEKTKVMAINASIEAARAGSRGSGFTVVAHEIGKLSLETSTNVEHISRSLTEIVTGIDETTSFSDRLVDEFSKIEDEVSSVSEILGSITQKVEIMDGQAENVASTSGMLDEMAESVSQITGFFHNSCVKMREIITNVNTNSETISKEIMQITNLSRSISSMITSVSSLGEKNLNSVTELSAQLDHFQTSENA
jgi:methyl-accepting chemotaxis protein